MTHSATSYVVCTLSTFVSEGNLFGFTRAADAPSHFVDGRWSMLPASATCTSYDAVSTLGRNWDNQLPSSGSYLCSESVMSLSRAVSDADAKVRALHA